MATVTPIASVRGILDAADRASAGAGVAILLADQDIEVASIGLSDGTGTALDAGSLTLNAAGEVVVHDNESNAEDLPHLVNSLESLNFATRVLATSMNNATFSRKMDSIPLPSSALTNGKQLFISGRTFALWSSGNKPDTGIYLVLCKEGQDPQSEGIFFNFADGVSSESRDFILPFSISVTAGAWTISVITSSAKALVKRSAAWIITHSVGWDDGGEIAIQSPISGSEGDPVILQLHIVTFDSSGTVAANLMISGQLSVISA